MYVSLKNKIITVTCEKIVFPGRSLCRCEDGVALFTDWLLPKEKADILVTRDKKTYREGILSKITLETDDRIKPKCESFTFCGGCRFQNLSYENQLILKQKYVEELLSFVGLNISTILKSPLQWNYRNKMEFSFFDNNGIVDIGLHKKDSFSRYISVKSCFIADDTFSKVVELVRTFARESKLDVYNNKTHRGFLRHLVLRKAQNNDQLLVNIVTSGSVVEKNIFATLVKDLSVFVDSLYWTINYKKSDVIIPDDVILLSGKSFIREKLKVSCRSFYFNITPFSFFQTNSKGTEILYDQILKLLKPSKQDTLLDLYCGAGTIGLTMAYNVKKLVGVDIVSEAIANAKENAHINDIDNAQFFVSSCQEWVNKAECKFDLIVVDPPRAGLTKDVINFLIKSYVKRIVYVSCNPSTLARDLQIILDSGIYKPVKIVPIDIFAHTSHVEVMVLLELNQLL